MTTNFFHPSLLLLFLDPGSEIRDPGWVKISVADPRSSASLTPGSGIPNPYVLELSDNFLGKKFYNSLKLAQIFFSTFRK
jgi:hypothetical protein